MNDKLRKKELFKTIIFLLIIGVTLIPLNTLFSRKSLGDPFNNQGRINSAYNVPKDTEDIIFIGSSHAYTSINPSLIYKETGIKSYVMASQQQSIAMSYYYIEEMLKTQAPKMIVLNTYMVNKSEGYDEAISRDAIEYMKPSLNKTKMIFDLVPLDETPSYFLTLLKYHSRWNELEAIDYRALRGIPESSTLGFVPLKDATKQEIYWNTDTSSRSPKDEINTEDLHYLNKIIDVTKKHDIKLILYNVPYSLSDASAQTMSSLDLFAKEKDIPLYDFSRTPEIFNLDYDADYYDSGHLNFYGANKFTTVFIQKIVDIYDVELNFNRSKSDYYDYKLEVFESKYGDL